MDWSPMLEAVMAAYGQSVTYHLPGRTPRPLTAAPLRIPIAAGDDIEDSGALVPMRNVLRFRASDFDENGPRSMAVIVFENKDRKQLTDVIQDPRGWYDCLLGSAP